MQKIVGMGGIVRDITDRKLAEEEKKSNEQFIKLNAERDKFFSIIAHDLKSPFKVFLNLTEIMADNIEDFSHQEFVEYSKSLNNTANNLYKLLENLLQWVQVQKGSVDFTPDNIDLSKMVSQSIDTFYQQAARKRIVIINEIASKQKAFADEKMIETVLRNLLSDAIKFTNKDGKFIVKSEPSGNGTIEVSVEDKGVE